MRPEGCASKNEMGAARTETSKRRNSWRAATTFSKFSHMYDLRISVVKAYLAGSAILGNLSPVGLGIGSRELRLGLLWMVKIPL